MKKEIEVLVRGIIQSGGKILVCKKKGNNYYFFPGGHVEFGENLKKALERELKEELGLKVKKSSFIGGLEQLFKEDNKKHHEINFIFNILINKINIKSKENHLEFFLFSQKELQKNNVLPIILKKAVLEWLKNKKPFWINVI